MDARRIEEMMLNHWPGLTTMVHEGWTLRVADGYTKRANSVSAIYGDEDMDEERVIKRIAWCERRFAFLGLPAIFKMTPFDRPAGLDLILNERGYVDMDHTSVQALDLAGIRQPERTQVHITEQLTEQWVDDFSRLNGVNSAFKPVMMRLLAGIRTKKGFVSFFHEGKVVACGLGVLEDEWLGLYDIVTDAGYRNRGIANQMILNMLHWGKAKGATHSYLAVVADNAPAWHLYAKLGYEEVYRYWYRVLDPHAT